MQYNYRLFGLYLSSLSSLRFCLIVYTAQKTERLGVEHIDAQTRLSIRLCCYGILGMTPAETVVRMMFASMPESLRELYF